jgi:DNA modification methylase
MLPFETFEVGKRMLILGDCLTWLDRTRLSAAGLNRPFDLTFLDPPFNQGKAYHGHEDDMPDAVYWDWMTRVCARVQELSSEGAAIYFMQREKNTESVLRALRESGWTYQNLIVWKKRTSAVPGVHRYGKAYQIIAFATKGARPRVFHRLRIDPPLPPSYRYERESGMFVTDVWDDIRELTSGYFAGDEALRESNGERVHKQQSPVQLLLRIILSSSNPGDVVHDPFAGTGTTLVVARQLGRVAVGIELSPKNAALIEKRLTEGRDADDVSHFREDYRFTPDLASIWNSASRQVTDSPRCPSATLRCRA